MQQLRNLFIIFLFSIFAFTTYGDLVRIQNEPQSYDVNVPSDVASIYIGSINVVNESGDTILQRPQLTITDTTGQEVADNIKRHFDLQPQCGPHILPGQSCDFMLQGKELTAIEVNGAHELHLNLNLTFSQTNGTAEAQTIERTFNLYLQPNTVSQKQEYAQLIAPANLNVYTPPGGMVEEYYRIINQSETNIVPYIELLGSPSSAYISWNNCNYSLGPKAMCEFAITYNPMNTEYKDTLLTIDDVNHSFENRVRLNSYQMSFSSTPIQVINKPSERYVLEKNQPLTVSYELYNREYYDMRLKVDNLQHFTLNQTSSLNGKNCYDNKGTQFNLAPGQACILQLTYTPTAVSEFAQEAVEITDGSTSLLSIPISFKVVDSYAQVDVMPNDLLQPEDVHPMRAFSAAKYNDHDVLAIAENNSLYESVDSGLNWFVRLEHNEDINDVLLKHNVDMNGYDAFPSLYIISNNHLQADLEKPPCETVSGSECGASSLMIEAEGDELSDEYPGKKIRLDNDHLHNQTNLVVLKGADRWHERPYNLSPGAFFTKEMYGAYDEYFKLRDVVMFNEPDYGYYVFGATNVALPSVTPDTTGSGSYRRDDNFLYKSLKDLYVLKPQDFRRSYAASYLLQDKSEALYGAYDPEVYTAGLHFAEFNYEDTMPSSTSQSIIKSHDEVGLPAMVKNNQAITAKLIQGHQVLVLSHSNGPEASGELFVSQDGGRSWRSIRMQYPVSADLEPVLTVHNHMLHIYVPSYRADASGQYHTYGIIRVEVPLDF